MSQKISSLSMNKHFAALGAAAAAVTGVGAVQQTQAAVVYSGVVNIPIPNNIDGVYLNVVTGLATTTATGAGAANPGFDINPYQSSATGPAMSFFQGSGGAPLATQRGYVAATATGAALALALGATIDGTSVYNTGIAAGTNFAPGSGDSFLGYRFLNEGTATVDFGWARINRTSPAAGTIGSIVDYGYENTGAAITAGAGIPEPTSLALLAIGAAGLGLRRRVA